jgi:hypothetical protein
MAKDVNSTDDDVDSDFEEVEFSAPSDKVALLEDKRKQLEKRRRIEEHLERKRLKEEFGVDDIDF